MTTTEEKKYENAKNIFIQQVNRIVFLTDWINDIFKIMSRKEDIMMKINPDCWETDDELNEFYDKLVEKGEVLYGYGKSLIMGETPGEE